MPGDALPAPARGWFPVSMRASSVFLADDSAILRKVVRAVLSEPIVARLGSLPAGAEQLEPQLVKGRDTPVVAHRVRAHDHINQGVLQ